MILLKADSHPGLRRLTVFCHFPVCCPVRPCWLLPARPSALPAVAFSVVRQANWVNFCDLADVHWELRSGQAHFYVCPKPRFQLGERLWNLFPKVVPKLCSSFLQNCLLGLRWLLNALNYAGSLCIFEHLCVIQIMGGHRAWLTKQLLFQNGKIPRSLTMHLFEEAEKRFNEDGTFPLNFHCAP